MVKKLLKKERLYQVGVLKRFIHACFYGVGAISFPKGTAKRILDNLFLPDFSFWWLVFGLPILFFSFFSLIEIFIHFPVISLVSVHFYYAVTSGYCVFSDIPAFSCVSFTLFRLTIRILTSYSDHIGSATNNNVKTSEVGVITAATIRMITMACLR